MATEEPFMLPRIPLQFALLRCLATGARLNRHRGAWLLTTGLLALLALAGAGYAADYTVHATVSDIDGKPLSGVEVAVGSIKSDLLKTSLDAEKSGTTDASGQVTVTLSTSSSPVGATVV